jgi:alpha-tubulin suppressor-like RCC1 family protein
MFGLPIYRLGTHTQADVPTCPGTFFGCGDGPQTAKSAKRLAQMVHNHFTVLISQDWKHLRAWGQTGPNGTGTYYGNVGVPASLYAQTVGVDWVTPGAPESIARVYTNGGGGNCWGTGYTILGTESDNLYGTGNNGNYILNRADTGIKYDNLTLIVSDVLDWCPSGLAALYFIRNGGKLYALGRNLIAGYGFLNGNQNALTRDTGPNGANYLGISDAKRVFSTTAAGGWISSCTDQSMDTNTRTFVLHNDGTVSACGNNERGSLGVASDDTFIYGWAKVKTSVNGVTQNLTNVKDIIVGNYYGTIPGDGFRVQSAVFLTEDGYVYTCGDNQRGQLGLGLTTNQTVNLATKTNLANIALIAPGQGGSSILAVTTDNKLYSWGGNSFGQLGLNHQNDVNIPTLADFPDKKITLIHGGGMYGNVYGAFLVVTSDGCVYAAGYNGTYALGYAVNGVPPPTLSVFTKNQYYGPNPEKNQDPSRYPLVLTASQTAGSNRLVNATTSIVKTVSPYTDIPSAVHASWTEEVFVRNGMQVTGTGIMPDTYVQFVDTDNKIILLTNPVTETITNNSVSYQNIIRVAAADLCGYRNELAQKCVGDDGTLYMSGWNQQLAGTWNFNPNIGTQTVLLPSAYEAKFES